MFRFFRSIRQQLLAENKTVKYAKYAVGEFLLIVAGILVALQIQNWNEERKDRVEERAILKRLQTEFDATKAMAEEWRVKHEAVKAAGEELLKLTGPDTIPSTEIENIANLLWAFIWVPDLDPPEGTLISIISSGQLGLISNEELRWQLASWPAELRNIEKEESTMSDVANHRLVSFLDSRISWRTARSIAEYGNSGPSNFPDDFETILQDREFENIVDGRVGYTLSTMNEYDKLLTTASQISALIEAELSN